MHVFSYYSYNERERTRGSFCRLLPLLLILLLPFFIYGLNCLDEKYNIYERVNEEYVQKYVAFNVDQAALDTLKEYAANGRDNLVYFFTVYLPERISVDKLLNKTYDITRKAVDFMYDFKPSTQGGHDITNKALNINKEEFLKGSV